jgi:hypothetical protein
MKKIIKSFVGLGLLESFDKLSEDSPSPSVVVGRNFIFIIY